MAHSRIKLVGLGLLAGLSGCGDGSSGPGTLTISCGDGVSVVGVERANIAAPEPGNPAAPATTVTYPDPVNTGHTGSLTLGPGQKCTIRPTTSAG